MLTICSWAWGHKYGRDYIKRLHAGLRRNMSVPFRFLLVTDGQYDIEGVDCVPIPDVALTKVQGCFARLRMFDPGWQSAVGIDAGERLACCDLDVIVTGPMAQVFDRLEPFVIFHGANAANPCPYNGSLWMLRAGYRPDVWKDFSLEAAAKAPYFQFPDDQGWFAHKLPGAAGWQVGAPSGIYAFQKPGWPRGDALPADARLVAFPGWRTPGQFTHVDWVKKHWTA